MAAGRLMLLLAAVLSALLPAPVGAAEQRDVCGLDCSSTHSLTNFAVCLLAIPPAKAAGNNTQVVFPGDATYDQARSVFNSRFQPFPAAVYYAYSAQGVSAAVKCGREWGVRVSPAAGRQSLQGTAVMDGYLIIDVTNITHFKLSKDNKTVSVGAGNNGIMVQTKAYETGLPLAIPGGFCSYVHVSGWTLGGGFGLLGRYLGLGCDQVVGLEVVLANGRIVKADKDSHSDLLWASCGGGGGTFGIVTSFEFKVNLFPDNGRLTKLSINYAPGNDSVQAFLNFQTALPTLDNRFGFVYSFGKGSVSLSGLFLGKVGEAQKLLAQAGLLNNLDPSATVDPSESEVAKEFPYGLVLKSQDSYWRMYVEGALEWSGSYFGQYTPWNEGGFTGSQEQMDFLMSLARGQAPGGHVVGGLGYSGWLLTQARLVRTLSKEAVQAIIEYVSAVDMECTASGGTAPGCLLALGGHVLGGAYSARPANATAYPHRDKYFVIDATLTFPTALVQSGPPEAGAAAIDTVNGFLSVLKPFLPKDEPEAGYINYLPPAFNNWQRGFFGKNYKRLQAIKARYDPLALFQKPMTVEGRRQPRLLDR